MLGYILVQLIGAALSALFLQAVIDVSAKFGSNYVAAGYSGEPQRGQGRLSRGAG